VSLRTGKVLREYSVIGGGVPDGRGGWFVVSGTTEIRRMSHDGSIRTDWHSRPTGRRVPAIGEIVRVGGRLFVEDGYRVYAISAATGRRIWTSQRADRGGILALAATSSAVYIGGDLAHVGDVHRGQVAALDPRTGRLLPWRAPALALFRDHLRT